MEPRVVVYADLLCATFHEFQFSNQLDADGPGSGTEANIPDEAAPD
jgi:hypothetical protein